MQYLGTVQETQPVNSSSGRRGEHNLGYYAVPWESILHGKCGEYGEYKIMSVLPDKLGRYLFEYHSDSYTSLGLPVLPENRSQIDVHGLLKPFQV